MCLCYITDREKENSTEQPTLQDNAIIIRLEDADVTTAQDNVDDEGVIHVPDDVWNHVIQEVEHPEQNFYNSLYLDVRALNIEDGITQDDITQISNYPITQNGTQTIPIPTGYDAVDSITLNVAVKTGIYYYNRTYFNVSEFSRNNSNSTID